MGIEALLQGTIEDHCTYRPLVHGRQDLDIAEGIEPGLCRDLLGHQFYNPLHSLLGIRDLEKAKTAGGIRGQKRQPTASHPMGIEGDQTLRILAVKLPEGHHLSDA